MSDKERIFSTPSQQPEKPIKPDSWVIGPKGLRDSRLSDVSYEEVKAKGSFSGPHWVKRFRRFVIRR